MTIKRVAFKTLGCRLNHYETDSIATQFDNSGYEIVDFNQQADIYIVNSCTVTHESDKKVKTYIKRANKANKDALKVIMGCMANSEKEALESLPYVDYVVENEKKYAIHSIVDSHIKGEFINLDTIKTDLFGYGIASPIFHTRSLIKIQDGCDNFCSFCIIPQVRGRGKSRPATDILDNIRNLVAKGYKEIVITGVNIGRYDSDGLNFEGLLKQILGVKGNFRVRISSLEPDGFSKDFYKLFKHPKLTPHLHLCLQSGSENVLKKMRRMYSLKEFKEIVHSMRKELPLFNCTTDIIVGFPGETREDFEKTLLLMEELKFGHAHTFKYSIRKRTKAANMENQIADNVKALRSERVRSLAAELQKEYRDQFIGTVQTILTERIFEEYALGYSEYFVPVKIYGKNLQNNTFHKLKIIGVESTQKENILIAKI